MTQHLFKNSFLRGVLFLLLCIVGIGNAWGEEVTVTFDANIDISSEATKLTKDAITIKATVLNGTKGYYQTYKSQDITISCTNGNITKIVFTCTASGDKQYGPGCYKEKSGNYSTSDKVGTWTGNAASVTLTASSNQVRMTKIDVTYEVDVNAPVLESIATTETPSNTTYYIGDTPSAEGLVVTATYSDNSTADVTSSASWSYEPATIASDTKSVTATASYGGKEASTTFNITVNSIANTEEDAYTISQAYELIDNNRGLTEEVYVKGIISQIDSYNSTDGSITYWISDDGTTTSQQFQCYSGLNIDGTQFTSINDLKLGSVVVVKGLLKKNNTTYEFDKNNVLISKDESNAITIESITIGGEATKTYYNIGETLSVEGLTVTANYSNSSTIDITEEVEWTFSPETIAKNTTQVTATATYREVYTASKVIDITVNQTELVYGMTPVYGGNQYYADESIITINDIQWSIIGGNTHMVPWRIGGKSLNNTDRDIKTMSPVYGTVSKVIVSVGETGESITFNSLTLSVANNADFTNATTYKETNPKASTDYTFYITEATDAYYKITYNVTVSSTSNKYYQFNGVKLYGTPASKDISLTNAGYATFCLPYDATIPEGLTAYTATDNGETVKLTAIESGKIAAGEGVVLKGKGGTYTFVATAEDVSATAGNQMVGVTEDTPLTSADNAYMLTRKKDDGSIAFRLLATDYTLGANKAYLKLENNARNLISVVWDDNATGIYDLSEKEEAENGAIYNLAGQKLMRTQKGINIINGKLVIK